MGTKYSSEIWRVLSEKIGTLEPFRSERDMQSFIMNHPEVVGCSLKEMNISGFPLKTLKEEIYLRGENTGRIDILGIGKREDDEEYELRLFELKLDEIDIRAVKQMVGYIRNWKNNEKAKIEAKKWLGELGLGHLGDDYIEKLVENPTGVLVGARFSPESIKEILEQKEYKIRGVRLARFSSSSRFENEYFVIIEDQIGRIVSSAKRKWGWSDLIKANLISPNDRFILKKGDIKITGIPDKEYFNYSQFKLILDEESIRLIVSNEEKIKESAKKIPSLPTNWIPKAIATLKSGKSITITQATGLFNYAILDSPGSYWVPSQYWIHEPTGKTLSELTKELSKRNA